MTPQTIFNVLILIISVNFLIDKVLDIINARHFNDKIPAELNDIYDEAAYLKSQQYKK